MTILGPWIRSTIEAGVAQLANKVFPTLGPVDADPPYAVYGVISASGLATLDDPDSELSSGTFSVDLYAKHYNEVWQLASAARDAIKTGAPTNGTIGFSSISAADLGREVETGLYHVSIRFEFSHTMQEA